jgi:hypothetical protein
VGLSFSTVIRFISFVMEPEMIAAITTYVGYASANDAAKAFVEKALIANPGIYPDEGVEGSAVRAGAAQRCRDSPDRCPDASTRNAPHILDLPSSPRPTCGRSHWRCVGELLEHLAHGGGTQRPPLLFEDLADFIDRVVLLAKRLDQGARDALLGLLARAGLEEAKNCGSASRRN